MHNACNLIYNNQQFHFVVKAIIHKINIDTAASLANSIASTQGFKRDNWAQDVAFLLWTFHVFIQ